MEILCFNGAQHDYQGKIYPFPDLFIFFFVNYQQCFKIYQFCPNLSGFFGDFIATLTDQRGSTPTKCNQMHKNAYQMHKSEMIGFKPSLLTRFLSS